jgi:hypothetical protein
MTDIVERLRALAAIDGCQASIDAADEITRLRADNLRLRAALKSILNYPNIREKIGNQLYDLGRAALDGQPAPSEWRPIDTAPKDGSRMLLAYRNSLGKWRRVIAFYAPKLAIEQNDYGSDWCEYDEASDRYFLPEGWYECIENWNDYSSVHMSGVEPTHWLPLPPAPGKEGA